MRKTLALVLSSCALTLSFSSAHAAPPAPRVDWSFSEFQRDHAQSVHPDGGGWIYVASRTHAGGGGSDFLIEKRKALDGALEWRRTWPPADGGGNNEGGGDAVLDAQGNLVVVGYGTDSGSCNCTKLLRYNPNGDLIAEGKVGTDPHYQQGSIGKDADGKLWVVNRENSGASGVFLYALNPDLTQDGTALQLHTGTSGWGFAGPRSLVIRNGKAWITSRRGQNDHLFTVVDLATRAIVAQLQHAYVTFALAPSPDGRVVALGSQSGDALLLTLSLSGTTINIDQTLVVPSAGNADTVTAGASDGQSFFVAAALGSSDDRDMALWTWTGAPSGVPVEVRQTVAGDDYPQDIATGTYPGRVYISGGTFASGDYANQVVTAFDTYPELAQRIPVKMMPNAGTREDFLASDGYGSFMTTPFGQISLCSDVGFTFNPYDAALDLSRGPYLASGVLDFSDWGFMYPWYGLACGDQVALFQGAVGDTTAPAFNFGNLTPDVVSYDAFIGPSRATRRTRFTVPGLTGVTVELDQTSACATLEKVYHFTNTSDQPISFRMVTTMDTDLQWGTEPGWAQWGYCHNWGRFMSSREVRMYTRYKDIWTTIKVEPVPGDTSLAFEGCRVFANGCTGGFREFGRVLERHGYPPTLLNGVFDNNDLSADADPADGWQDWKGDNALTCQGLFTLAAGQTGTWRQVHSAEPANCSLTVAAGPDQDVSVSPANQCVAEVDLAGTAASTGAPPLAVSWHDGTNEVATTATTTVPWTGPAGSREYTLSACDHMCQPADFPETLREPFSGEPARACDDTYCYYPAGDDDCEEACKTDKTLVDLAIENCLPVADAGPDRTIGSLASFTLDGSASHAAAVGGPLTYAWTQIGGPTWSPSGGWNPAVVRPTGIGPELELGELVMTFRLTVTDIHGQTDSDEVDVVVSHVPNLCADGTPDRCDTAGEGAFFVSVATSVGPRVALCWITNAASADGELTCKTDSAGALRLYAAEPDCGGVDR